MESIPRVSAFPTPGKDWVCDVHWLLGVLYSPLLDREFGGTIYCLHTHPLLINAGDGVSDLVLLLYHLINHLNRDVSLLPLQKRPPNNSQGAFVLSLSAPA